MNKINSYIGFAIKSGKVVYGIDSIEKANKHKIELILYAETTENTYQKLLKITDLYCIKFIKVSENNLPSNVKILAITDQSLAKIIIEKLENSEDC